MKQRAKTIKDASGIGDIENVIKSDPKSYERNRDYFEVGGIYNKTYFGSNEAYKKQNGKTTIEILSINAENGNITSRQLFYAHASPSSDMLYGGACSWNLKYMVASQKEYTYERVDNSPDKWRRHSKILSVKEAVGQGYITKETIEAIFRDKSKDWMRRNPVTYHGSFGGERYLSLSTSLDRPCSENPLLQSIVFKWNNSDEMEADVRSVFPDAWFM